MTIYLEFTLDRDNGIPLYVQIKNEIKKRIRLNHWSPGYKLPTEREFAELLQVSRNTVSNAYKDLVLEGFLISQQGRGTFVTGEPAAWSQEGKKLRLLKLIDLAIEEASQLTFNLDEFLTIALDRAQKKKAYLKIARVAFISTEREYCEGFRQDLYPEIKLEFEPILLQQLKKNKSMALKRLTNVELIVTPFFCLGEVKRLLDGLGKPILGAALNLDMEVVVDLARIPQHSTVGLICNSHSFARNFQDFLTRTGIQQFTLKATQSTGQELISFIDEVDIIAVSSGRKDDMLLVDKPILELSYKLDQGSISSINSALLELQEKLLK